MDQEETVSAAAALDDTRLLTVGRCVPDSSDLDFNLHAYGQRRQHFHREPLLIALDNLRRVHPPMTRAATIG
jgi:hypothetical protein